MTKNGLKKKLFQYNVYFKMNPFLRRTVRGFSKMMTFFSKMMTLLSKMMTHVTILLSKNGDANKNSYDKM